MLMFLFSLFFLVKFFGLRLEKYKCKRFENFTEEHFVPQVDAPSRKQKAKGNRAHSSKDKNPNRLSVVHIEFL